MTAVMDPAPATSSMSERKFGLVLALIALVALAIRIGAAYFYDANTKIWGDAVWYLRIANSLPNGDGFIEPLQFLIGQRVPTAAHPPLYPLYLSVMDFAGANSNLLHRLWSCIPGTGTVVLLGIIGRDLAGRRAGLIAAGLAAVSIELLAQDVMLWSEGFYGFTVALTVLAAYRYLRSPDLLHGALLGGAIAIAALTRAEAVLLFLILLVPLVLRTREQTLGRRVKILVAGGLVAMVLMVPWLIYNNRGRFKHPVGVTVTFGTLIGSSYCDATFYGEGIGGWGGLCRDTVPNPWPRDESVAEQRARDAGFDYAMGHLNRLPIVVAHRLGRSFGFWAPVKSISDDLLFAEAKVHRLAYVALLQYWLYLGFGIAGGVLLYRRRVAMLPLLAPVITVVVITVIGYGGMRFRMALDVVLPILAAVAIEKLVARRRAGTAPDPPVGAGTVATDS